jgi:hypothetical protein
LFALLMASNTTRYTFNNQCLACNYGGPDLYIF